MPRRTMVGSKVRHIRIVDSLAQGGMGEIYIGFDETLERQVALKAIRRKRRLDPETRSRFLHEARVLSQLDHPNICRIHDCIESDDNDFLVLELIRGRTLRTALSRGVDSPMKIARQVAAALVAAHAKGIIHRDLKPDNVMFTDDGGVKVLDFG